MRKGREFLKVEVKGVSAADIYFELTPNEYKKLKEHAADYRVCVVCDALTEPQLFELLPRNEKSQWYVVSKNGAIRIPLAEKMAAIARDIPRNKS